MDVDALTAAGVYDPSAPDAQDRLELLTELDRFGLSPTTLAAVDREIGLTFVPILALLDVEGADYTTAEVAAALGVGHDELQVYLRTAGLPAFAADERPFTDEDIEMFRVWGAVRDRIGRELGEQLLRTAGASCARLAESGIATFVQVTSSPDVDTGTTDLERVRYNDESLATYFAAADSFTTLLRHHMRAALQRWQIAGEQSPRQLVRFFVGFVDLVGYTPLSHQLSTDELSAMLDQFESVALRATAAHNGRIVKRIGDEVMFVANTVDAALDIALTMVDEFADPSGATTPRGGVAVGDVLGREGDFYGPAVNLASRAADLAVPDEILVSEEVFEAAQAEQLDGFDFVPAGRRQLKGFPEPVQLWSVSRS